MELSSSQKNEEGLAILNSISTLSPEIGRAKIEKLRILHRLDKPKEAIEEALRIDKNDFSEDQIADYYAILGSLYDKNNEREKSIEIYNEALKIYPQHYLLYYNRAVTYMNINQNKKAYDDLLKSVEIFPNYAKTHYFLGLLAINNGNLTEGTLALTTSVLLDEGAITTNAIQIINGALSKKYEEPEQTFEIEGSDQFDSIEQVLRKQYALDKGYKLNSELDYPYTRQLQALISESTKITSREGFFASKYLNFYSDLAKNNQFENLSYYLFQNFNNEAIQKLVSKKSSNIKKFSEWFLPNIVETVLTTNFNGKKVRVVAEDMNIGYGDVVNKKKNGLWIYNYFYGKKAIETTFKDGLKEGMYTSFHPNGKVEAKIPFKNDVPDAKAEIYHDNGNISITKQYVNGKQEVYNYFGGLKCTTDLKNDQKDGKEICYYKNGNILSESNFVNGLQENKTIEYYPNKDIKDSYNAAKNYYDGDKKSYFPDKTLQEEYVYKNGNTVGDEKTYYANGDLKALATTNPSKYIKYFGKEIQQEVIFKDDKMTNQIIYLAGKPYLQLFLTGGDGKEYISSYHYYNSAGLPEKEYTLTKGSNFEIKSPDNKIYLSGSYNKNNQKHGEWKYYNLVNGLLESKTYYENGLQTKILESYFKNGRLKESIAIKDDKKQGPYKEYFNIGGISSELNYINNVGEGEVNLYHENGKLKAKYFIENNEAVGKYNSYDIDGMLISTLILKEGESIRDDQFYNGAKVSSLDYSKNGAQTYFAKSNIESTYTHLKNGYLNGKTVLKSNKDEIALETDYIDAKRYGNTKQYHPNQNIYIDSNYLNNELYGDYKMYDLNGKLISTRKNAGGATYGPLEKFTFQGMKYYEGTYYENKNNGPEKYFGSNNELLLTINYYDGTPYSYQKNQDATPTPLKNETTLIVANYKDGKPGLEISFKNGEQTSNYKLYHQKDTLLSTSQFVDGYLEGERKNYGDDGKIYSVENFKNGDYHGKREIYYPNGKVKIVAHYSNDFLHGNYQEFSDTGKLLMTKVYNNGVLIENK